MPKTVDEQQAEIFMAYAKKRIKDNLQKIEPMTSEEKIKQKRKEYAKRYYEKNRALGLVKDNVETLVKLKKYLEKSYVS